MLEIVAEAREKAPWGRVLFVVADDKTADDERGCTWVAHNEFIQSCAICDHACADGWRHEESQTIICSDCVEFWEYESIRMTESELDSMCDAAEVGDEVEAERIVRAARERNFGKYIN